MSWFNLKDDFQKPFCWAMLQAMISVVIAGFYFQSLVIIAATALLALSLSKMMYDFLDDNRAAIWERAENPNTANMRLAIQISALFFGIFCGTILLQGIWPQQFIPKEISLDAIYKNDFMPLLKHNFGVLFGGIVLSFIYRSGGLVLVLAWNALNWSVSFLLLSKALFSLSGFFSALSGVTSIVPHLTFEVFAYVLGGMAGIFVSKAFKKYSLKSDEFWQVASACVGILVVSLGSLVLSVTLEIYLAQQALRNLGV